MLGLRLSGWSSWLPYLKPQALSVAQHITYCGDVYAYIPSTMKYQEDQKSMIIFNYILCYIGLCFKKNELLISY